jgi:putative ABC transport system permease protein
VVADVKFSSLSTPKFEEMYLPYQQSPWMAMTIVVRSSSAMEPLVSALREKITELDPDLPLTGIQPMETVVSVSVGQPRLITGLVGGFAGFALLLAALGIYGVMAYSVSQRSHELGIRMALGAAQKDIFRLVLSQGMRLVLTGIALGSLGSLALTRLLATLLFGTSANDPLTFARRSREDDWRTVAHRPHVRGHYAAHMQHRTVRRPMRKCSPSIFSGRCAPNEICERVQCKMA